MNKCGFVFTLLLVLVLSPGVYCSSRDSSDVLDWDLITRLWNRYLDFPSGDNALKLYEVLPDNSVPLSGDSVEEKLDAIYEDIEMLERQVLSGDTNSVKLAFRMMNIADGFYAEILDIILGSIIRIHPKLFLTELKNHRHSVIGLDGLVGNFGMPFVDREKAHQLEADLRIKALESVSDKETDSLRQECIRILQDE